MTNITKNNKPNNLISKIKQFFFTNGWKPLPYQIESWEAFLNGENGIIQVPTGCGKTYAALMGPLSKIEDPKNNKSCLLYTSPSPRDTDKSRMPSSA